MLVGPYKIVESITGCWHYHLAPIRGDNTVALCGKPTMPTGGPIPLNFWGHKSDHIPESYCKVCEKMALAAGGESQR